MRGTVMLRATPWLVLALATGAGCGSKSAPPAAAGPTGPSAIGTAYYTADLPRLSDYSLFDIEPAALIPRSGVVPYDVNTPLFADYSVKERALYVPKGQRATYHPSEPFDFPIGTIVSKTFSSVDDARAPKATRRIETRLLVRAPDGWLANTYRWNDAQTDAELLVSGEIVPLSFVGPDGAPLKGNYLVPNANQCKKCHENSDMVMGVIGLQARHLNRDFVYPDGTTENQLAHWARVGMIEGAEAPSVAPRLPVWNDPATGSVDERTRAWLDTNCAHCHSEKGTSRTTGLTLTYFETDPYKLGLCKPPVAAGKGTGGFSFDIVPGSPQTSILVYRLRSTTTDEQMPELGRSIVDAEAVSLVESWIGGLGGTCTAGGM